MNEIKKDDEIIGASLRTLDHGDGYLKFNLETGDIFFGDSLFSANDITELDRGLDDIDVTGTLLGIAGNLLLFLVAFFGLLSFSLLGAILAVIFGYFLYINLKDRKKFWMVSSGFNIRFGRGEKMHFFDRPNYDNPSDLFKLYLALEEYVKNNNNEILRG